MENADPQSDVQSLLAGPTATYVNQDTPDATDPSARGRHHAPVHAIKVSDLTVPMSKARC